MASKIKEVIKRPTSHAAKGLHYEKGDYIRTTNSYIVNTNYGRQCSVSRAGVLAMLAEVGIPLVKRTGSGMLRKLQGHILNESFVVE